MEGDDGGGDGDVDDIDSDEDWMEKLRKALGLRSLKLRLESCKRRGERFYTGAYKRNSDTGELLFTEVIPILHILNLLN